MMKEQILKKINTISKRGNTSFIKRCINKISLKYLEWRILSNYLLWNKYFDIYDLQDLATIALAFHNYLDYTDVNDFGDEIELRIVPYIPLNTTEINPKPNINIDLNGGKIIDVLGIESCIISIENDNISCHTFFDMKEKISGKTFSAPVCYYNDENKYSRICYNILVNVFFIYISELFAAIERKLIINYGKNKI